MYDLISRQAAIDALGEDPIVWEDDGEWDLAERDTWRRHKRMLEELPSKQSWTPTSERNPSKSGEYLVTLKQFMYNTGKKYVDKRDFSVETSYWNQTSFDVRGGLYVTAWMELPKPYEEENHEQIQG